MILTPIDLAIVLGLLILMVSTVMTSRSQMKSVADFLAANRSAGRYLIAVSGGIAAIGAITIVGNFEMNFMAGFAMTWWGMSMGVIILLVTLSGWVVYRFRQTRCLTLAQFFEVRYSRKFRIFTGMLAFFSGIVNMGIFPAVEARFFIYFCGLPHTVEFLGIELSTFALIMATLIGISIWFVFSGGQVAVIVSDFFQGTFVNIVMVLMVVYFALKVDWNLIFEALQQAPVNKSLINPFKTGEVENFNFWYFLIGVVGYLYSVMSWQGTGAYNASAVNPHEAKMAGVLSLWRGIPQSIMMGFIPIVAYTVLNHPHFAEIAKEIGNQMIGIHPEAVRSQVKVPLVLQHLLPTGLMGAFVAVMLSAAITTEATYMHSWGSILVQDVILPLRKKPFSNPKQHLLALRLAILFVAVFIFCFSLLFKQTQYIFLFFAITGAIFAGGSGAVIIGGLYWKYGTTPAAWAALITGSTISVVGIIIHHYHENFFINGQEFWAISMGASAFMFVLVSLIGKRKVYDFDKLFHRGKYALAEDQVIRETVADRFWKLFGMGKEFSWGDRIIYIANYVWTVGWFLVFIIGTIYNLSNEVSDAGWMKFWKIHLAIHLGLAVISVIWFTIGGVFDLRKMFRLLSTRKRDVRDDGFVRPEEQLPSVTSESQL
ncbi:MAG: sodium:solute symporter [bacterium]|nr:sodium:solute symporter [bacterium]